MQFFHLWYYISRSKHRDLWPGIGYVDDNLLLRLHTELATMASSKHCSF
ncbi:unnamed protein product [Arabidopsis thaliana]|uniref:(thale cress) hypothetical protein n=1 Tax=Arabidopsis thaliana TaxID=3702 RepID=A0A7G2EWP0_ARATH|nr:unnamed protein product [Arabidopsis thaliana]